MRSIALCIGGALALSAIAGFASPAMACRYSRPIFAADPGRTLGAGPVRVRVEQALLIQGRLAAVRATVLGDSGIARRGDSIVIVVPRDDTANCYYGGLADPATIAGDGSLEGYVVLMASRELSGAFSARLASERDRLQYDLFAQGRLRGRWVQARFQSGEESSE